MCLHCQILVHGWSEELGIACCPLKCEKVLQAFSICSSGSLLSCSQVASSEGGAATVVPSSAVTVFLPALRLLQLSWG